MVTKEKFEQYERFLKSGTPNMADLKMQDRTGLSREDCLDILQNYASYAAKFKVLDEVIGLEPEPEPEPEENGPSDSEIDEEIIEREVEKFYEGPSEEPEETDEG